MVFGTKIFGGKSSEKNTTENNTTHKNTTQNQPLGHNSPQGSASETTESPQEQARGNVFGDTLEGLFDKAVHGTLASTKHLMDQGKQRTKIIADKLTDRRITIGMTAQSGAGKTTATTSLINQLLNFDHRNARLAQFSPFSDDRIVETRLLPLEDTSVKMFPYAEAFEAISSDPPRWPAATQTASGCVVALCLRRAAGSLLGRAHYTVHVEIRDYPGEWLIDLQLLDKDYLQWCNLLKGQYTVAPRKRLLGTLFDALANLDPFAPCDETKLNALHTDFVAFLNRCKKQRQLSSVQPGRFLLGDPKADPEQMCFIPLLAIPLQNLDRKALQKSPANSYYHVCRRRYQNYIRQLVRPFYKDYFSKIDRQIVLVDVLSALEGGAEYVEDLQLMLKETLHNFHYGYQNRLMNLITPKIDTICFAATKIDQILAQEHENVKQLLGRMVRNVSREVKGSGIKSTCEAISAVNTSHNKIHKDIPTVWGHNLDGDYIGYTHPEIPQRLPTPEEWKAFEMTIPRFRPPAGLCATNSDILPHIRMDSILDLMIERK